MELILPHLIGKTVQKVERDNDTGAILIHTRQYILRIETNGGHTLTIRAPKPEVLTVK